MKVRDLIIELSSLDPDSEIVIIEGGVSIIDPFPFEKVGDLVSSSVYWSDLYDRGLKSNDYVITVF